MKTFYNLKIKKFIWHAADTHRIGHWLPKNKFQIENQFSRGKLEFWSHIKINIKIVKWSYHSHIVMQNIFFGFPQSSEIE